MNKNGRVVVVVVMVVGVLFGVGGRVAGGEGERGVLLLATD